MKRKLDSIFNTVEGKKYGGNTTPPYADYNGCRLLCAAIIEKAHNDYIFSSTDRERASIIKFINSALFRLYTFGVDVEAQTVIDIWERERVENGKFNRV